MTGSVGGPLLVGGLGPGTPLNPALSIYMYINILLLPIY